MTLGSAGSAEGTTSIGGVPLLDGMRVKLTGQADESYNGVWYVRSLRRNRESTEAGATCVSDLHLPSNATSLAREEA